MDINKFVLIFFIGITLCFIIINAHFFDFISILTKIIPSKSIKGYDEHKKLYESLAYKNHVKKWKRRFYIFIIPIYVTVFVLIELFLKNIAISFPSSLVVSSILFGFLGNKESKIRKEIKKTID